MPLFYNLLNNPEHIRQLSKGVVIEQDSSSGSLVLPYYYNFDFNTDTTSFFGNVTTYYSWEYKKIGEEVFLSIELKSDASDGSPISPIDIGLPQAIYPDTIVPLTGVFYVKRCVSSSPVTEYWGVPRHALDSNGNIVPVYNTTATGSPPTYSMSTDWPLFGVRNYSGCTITDKYDCMYLVANYIANT